MAQSQAIFDCCRGNPLLLFPLPEGDNGFALLPSCTCHWDETLALCHVERPCQKRCHCVALSSIFLRVERHSVCPCSFILISLVSQCGKSLYIKLRGRNKNQTVDNYSEFTLCLLTLISRVICTVCCKDQTVLKASVFNPNVDPLKKQKPWGKTSLI